MATITFDEARQAAETLRRWATEHTQGPDDTDIMYSGTYMAMTGLLARLPALRAAAG